MNSAERPPFPNHMPSVYIWRGDIHIERARKAWASPRDWRQIRKNLIEASLQYRMGGLGLLADRCGYFARRVEAYGEITNVRELWAQFDRLNTDTPYLNAGGRP